MTTFRSRPSSPVSLLALVVLVAALGFGLRRTLGRRESGTACPGGEPHCVAAGGASGSGAAADSFPHLEAKDACRDVAYLCADLATEDPIRIQHWRDFDGTLVVHVPRPAVSDPELALRLQHAATAGIRQWNGAPFPILVDERGNRRARIEVSWVPSLGESRVGVAHTQWSSEHGLAVLSIELVTRRPGDGAAVSPDQVQLTAAHEMGHALGLPHSDNPHDVMYPTNTATALSARDYKAVGALYALRDGTVIAR